MTDMKALDQKALEADTAGHESADVLLMYLRGCLSRTGKDGFVSVPRSYIDRAIALLAVAEAVAGTPEGWMLVPREPTHEMGITAFRLPGITGKPLFDQYVAAYRAMLSAAPQPNHIGGRLICEALGFDPTNHHNAAKCPYCNPDGLAFASPLPVSEEQVEVASDAILISRFYEQDDDMTAGWLVAVKRDYPEHLAQSRMDARAALTAALSPDIQAKPDAS